jgi:rubrerythrin
MQDLISRHEKLLLDAADCEMIGALATNAEKRELFRRLAKDLKQLAVDLRAEIERRERTGI